MFLGLVGFIVVVAGLSWAVLTVWKPAGVRHAHRYSSEARRKTYAPSDIEIVRSRVDVVAEDVRMKHIRRVFPSLGRVDTPILSGIDARFPSGQLSVIMGPSGSGKSTLLKMCAGRPAKAGLMSTFTPQGRILFNGVPVSPKTRHICAFVEQGECTHCVPKIVI